MYEFGLSHRRRGHYNPFHFVIFLFDVFLYKFIHFCVNIIQYNIEQLCKKSEKKRIAVLICERAKKNFFYHFIFIIVVFCGYMCLCVSRDRLSFNEFAFKYYYYFILLHIKSLIFMNISTFIYVQMDV